MAKNDYSRRSSKDVFWGDDNSNKNSSKSDELDELFRESERIPEDPAPIPTPPPYIPPSPNVQEVGKDDDDGDKVENNDNNIVDNEVWDTEGDYDSTEIADDAVPFMTAAGWNGLEFAPSVVLDNAPDEIPPEEQPDANPMPTSITVNKYTPQYQYDTQFDIDVDKFSQQYENQISKLITIKITGVIVAVCIAIVGFCHWDFTVLYVVVATVVCVIISSVSQRKYAEIIKELIKDFKVIDSYTHVVGDMYQKVCANIFSFQKFNASECDYYREDLTVINTGGGKTHVAELRVSYTTGSGKNSHTDILFTGEYYTFAMPKPYADGVLVCKGIMPVVETNQYYDCKYRFYAINQNMPNSDFGHITHIVDRLSENYKDDFALYFEGGCVHLLIKTTDITFFDFGFFDFSVKEKLKRDVPRLALRVKIAEILAE